MPLQLTGSINLSGSITVSSGSITVVSGSINLLSGTVNAPNKVYTMVFDDMEFSHTSGSRSYYSGVGVPMPVADGFGAGYDGERLVLYPTASAPYSRYENFTSTVRNVKILGYRLYTNIVGADFPLYDNNSNSTVTRGYVNLGTAWLSGPSSVNSAQFIQEGIYSYASGSYEPFGPYGSNEWSVVPDYAIKSPTDEILEAGTLYIKQAYANAYINLAPTDYSPTYFTFLMSIGSAFRTKTYKFRFEFDLEDFG